MGSSNFSQVEKFKKKNSRKGNKDINFEDNYMRRDNRKTKKIQRGKNREYDDTVQYD